MEDNKIPDFAIFQNSRTRQSAIWSKEAGHWIDAKESEYEPLAIIVNLIRHSPNPQEIVEELARVALRIREENS
jgi:hypothetical protein